MHNKAYEMGKWAITNAKEKGFDSLTPEDWVELKNCMDVVKSAICAEKDYKIVEAMDEETERMGYNNRRYESGRYAPAGRGHMGYYEPDVNDDYAGYTNTRLGYNGAQRMNRGRYGYSIDEAENMLGEMMRDATPEERQRYKMKLQQLAQKF